MSDYQKDILDALDRIPLGDTPYMQASFTAGRPLPAAPLSLDQILTQINNILAEMPPEPLGEWMRGQGFPPETCSLLLPLAARDDLPYWPPYVTFTPIVKGPTLARFRMPP